MRPTRMMAVVGSMLALGCVSDVERGGRVAEIRDRVRVDASAASSCAAELHTIGNEDPVLVANALDLQEVPAATIASVVPSDTTLGVWARRPNRSELAERTWREVARREALIAADLAQIDDGGLSDREALDRAFRAGAQARQVRDLLCQARDVATTLAAVARTRSGETASARRAGTAIPHGTAAFVVSHER